MDAIKRRPASTAALVLSVLWVIASIYEVHHERHNDQIYGPTAGHFYEVYSVLQLAVIGVIVFLALAVLVERIWAPSSSGAPRAIDEPGT